MNTRSLTFWLLLTTAPSMAQGQTNFTKITTGDIVNDGGASVSVAWGDYDNDGYVDLFVSNDSLGGGARNFLYHNNRNGTFTRINSGPITTDVGDFRGAAWVDYDNDGKLDLSVVSEATKNFLYRNNGDGTFMRETNIISSDTIRNSIGGSWADYDRDGFVDFFVANADLGNNLLYHNNGDNTFTKITSGPIVNDVGHSLSCAWADYDNDGFPELFVSNFLGPTNSLYDLISYDRFPGEFQRVTNAGSIVTSPANSIGCAWGDYDNDGFLDLFVANDGILNNEGSPCFLFRNNGDRTFSKITGIGLEEGPTRSPSCAWGDYDNDGYLDLLVLNNNNHNFLYHNEGDGTFTRVTTGAVVNDGGPGYNSSGCSWVDYDNDGFLDLFIANGAGPSGPGPHQVNNFLYHNEGNSNAWIKIKCIGAVSNRSAIGAKVRVTTRIRGKMVRQLREVTMGDGFQSGSPLETHFGLGDATNIDLVRVEWPSGIVQDFQNLSVKQFLILTEPSRLAVSVTNGAPQLSLQGGRAMRYDLQSSTDLQTWLVLGNITITNLNGTVLFADTNATSLSRRFYRAELR